MSSETKIIEPNSGNSFADELKTFSGVNVAGYFNAESGLGEGVRATVRALKAVEIPFALNNCDFNLEYHYADNKFTQFSEKNPHPVNIVQINADSIFKFLDSYGEEYFKNHYNIGFWLWEMIHFPSHWYHAFNLFDEIWTPSNFCVEAISSVSPVPVVNIPLSIDLPTPQINRAQLELPDNKFIFLFIFDFCSSFERKNPIAALKSFIQAFGRENKEVLLVIKASNAEFEPAKAAEMKALADGAANIKFINKSLPRAEINALIYNADCYVSLHRAEGFGLTPAEAMFYGKPVIATDYSANTDFMNVTNSFPIKFRLEKLTENVSLYSKGDEWAEADVDHAAQIMRYVFENQDAAKKIGEKAAADIREKYSPLFVGQKIKNRLHRISDLQNGFVKQENEEEFKRALNLSRIKLERIEARNFNLSEKVNVMEASRFWKIRTQWFKLKRGLGITRKY